MVALGSSFAVLDGLHGYPAAGGQAVRYAVASCVLFSLARRRPRAVGRRQLVRLALLAASGLAGFNLLVLAAEASMDPGGVGVVVATVPVLFAFAVPLQARRRPQAALVASAALVALGAVVVQARGGTVTPEGLAAATGALACEAAFSMLAAPLLAPLGPVTVSAWATALAVPLLVVAGLATDGPAHVLALPTTSQALALAWLAIPVTTGAFLAWYWAVSVLGVERAGLFSGVLPVSALLFAALLGSSQLSAARLLGVLAVAVGIAGGLRVR